MNTITFKNLVFGLGAYALLFLALGVLALVLIGIPMGLFYGVSHLTGSLAFRDFVHAFRLRRECENLDCSYVKARIS